jgi:hypothetical protein
MQNPGVENWEERVGERVVCPKPGCGKPGVLAIDTFRAKGRVYTYLVVRHYEGDKVKRCVIKRITEPAKPAKPEAAKPAKSEEAELEQLRQEAARLREENERLEQENEQLRQALVSVYNARLSYRRGGAEQPLLAGGTERYYLKLVAKDKKTDRQIAALGLNPAEVRAVANGIIEALVSTDFAAVRLDAWRQLEEVVARWL